MSEIPFYPYEDRCPDCLRAKLNDLRAQLAARGQTEQRLRELAVRLTDMLEDVCSYDSDMPGEDPVVRADALIEEARAALSAPPASVSDVEAIVAWLEPQASGPSQRAAHIRSLIDELLHGGWRTVPVPIAR